MGPNGPVPRRERLSREKRRELRELGFDPNEGYDYTRHLRQVGEGGGTMFVPTRKDHVKGIRERDGEVAEHKLTAGGSGKKGTDSELVYLKEDVERDGDAARAINDERSDTAQARAASEEDERWTHERVKAVTREKVYVAKDTSAANAVVARAVRARPKGGAPRINNNSYSANCFVFVGFAPLSTKFLVINFYGNDVADFIIFVS